MLDLFMNLLSTTSASSIDFLENLSRSDMIAFAAAGITLVSAGISVHNATSARRTYEEAERQRLSQSRPHLDVRPATQGLVAAIDRSAFEVADPDGLPFALNLRNAGRGRSDRIDIFCELGVGEGRVVDPRRVDILKVPGSSIEAFSTPQQIALLWRSYDAPVFQATWTTRKSCDLQADGLEVGGEMSLPLEHEFMREWVGQALGGRTDAELRCLLTYTSDDGEVVHGDARFRLEPHLEAPEGDGLTLRFRVTPVRDTVRQGGEARAARRRDRREARAYVAVTRQRERMVRKRLAAVQRMAS